MPAKSKAQAKFMEAAAHNKEFADKVGIRPEVAREFTSSQRPRDIKRLPVRVKKGRK